MAERRQSGVRGGRRRRRRAARGGPGRRGEEDVAERRQSGCGEDGAVEDGAAEDAARREGGGGSRWGGSAVNRLWGGFFVCGENTSRWGTNTKRFSDLRKDGGFKYLQSYGLFRKNAEYK